MIAVNNGQINDSLSGNVEKQQITTFADDSNLVSGAKPGISSISTWKSFAEENKNHGILDILSRPVLLTNSSSIWSTTKLINERPTEAVSNSVFSFPDSILEKSSNILKKIEYFAYFRADVKVRIMVNAQPFSQGKLWIWFSPYELSTGTQTVADNLTAKTGYPGLELDVASGVPVEFMIPYCAPQSHYCLTSGEGTMGDLFLTVLAPLTVSDASISVFAWFENIDLQLPTGAPKKTAPQVYDIANPAVAFTYNTKIAVSPAWSNASITANGIDTGTLVENLVCCDAGRFGVFPKGTKFTLTEETAGVYLTDTLGNKGMLAAGLSGNSVKGLVSTITSGNFYTFVIWPHTDYKSFISSGATFSPTSCSIPNTFNGLVNVPSIVTKDMFLVNSSDNKFYVFPALSEAIYKPNGTTKTFTNNTVSGNMFTSGTVVAGAINFNNDIGSQNAIIAQSFDNDFPFAQMTESEQQAYSGVVTNGFKMIDSMSKIPLLSSISTPLSWVSRIGSVVSAGFSKPTDVSKIQPIYNVPAKGFTHGEDVDCSVSLGLIPDNSLDIKSGIFSSNIDEMDVSYIAQKSCFLRTDEWTTTTTGKIFSIFVSPGISTIVGAAYQPTHLGYLCSMFKFWHGSIRYRISVAKTGFHSGRLRISFHPAAYLLDSTYVTDNAYSWILDLSVSSEVDIEIPYVSTKPWLISDLFDKNSINPYGPSAAIGSNIGANNLNFATGVLQIEVLNQLRNAGQASSSVPLITWISGGNDIEFSVPNFTSFRPCNSQQNIRNEPIEQDLPIYAQAFQNISDASSNMSQLDGSEFTRMFRSSNAFSDSSTLCMGEKVSNLRTLIKRFTPFVLKLPTASGVGASSVSLDPAYFGTLEPQDESFNLPTQIIVNNKTFGSYTNCQAPIEYISKIFRFYRGSRRYKCVSGNANTGDNGIQNFLTQAYLNSFLLVNGKVSPPLFFQKTSTPATSFSTSGKFSHWVDGDNNKVCEISVPFYSMTPIQLVSDGTFLPQSDDYIARYTVVFDNSATSTNNSKQMMIYQAAGDDFSFGYLIGPPLLVRVEKVAYFG